MKKIALFVLSLALMLGGFSAATAATITLGTQEVASGTSGIGPTNYYWEARRIQWVYTASEIISAGGFAGTINSIAYDVSQIAGGNLVNYKIKMAHTTATDASSHNTAPLTTVKNSHTFSPGATGWRTITFDTGFVWDGTNNILFDVSWGVNSGWGSSGQVWLYDNNLTNQMRDAHSGSSSVENTATNASRSGKPRAQLDISPGGIVNPTAFTATASSATQIDLSWVLNSTPDNVLLAWNTTNTFGTPSGSYTAGDAITGGGTVLLANSSATSFNHTGLTPNTTYYYRIWSQNGAGPTYSGGAAANATTFIAPITSFPWTETFETTSSTRAGWSQIQEFGDKSWTWATGSNGGSITTAYDGTLNARYTGSTYNGHITKLVTPTLDLSGVTNPTLSFWYGQEAWGSDQNTLAIYYRTSPTGAWTQIGSDYTSNISSWTQVTGILLPNPSSTYQLAFEGTDNYGRANVLDDVVVSGFSGVLDPTSFTATAVSATQIDLSWVLNSIPDNVLLAWNTTNTFGTPSGSYTAGDAITGGGTVLLANSSATNFNHSGLTPSTTYYYMIWSQNGAVPTYSNGVAANATTPMAPITSFPWTEDLTGVTVGSIPTGWSQTGTSPHWSAQSTNYAGGTSPEFRFYWSPGQTDTFRLITPPLDGSVGDLQLSFKHFIDYYNTPATYAVQYTTNGGATWNTLWSIVDPTANVGSITQVVDLSAINTVFQLAWVYDGNSYNTDNWYVDDISVSLAVPEITISESSYNFGLAFVNASNCTPRYFIAQNTGGGTATIASAPQFTGTDASQFTLIDTNTYPIALNASEYAYWGVKFEPSSYGEKTAY
ncbi:MAG: hypothetical protein QM233_03965, partial [Candidatus Cloacimonadota bacterium]|nr:hypothetical protein [Candidatus Cloacimonadota bacterium]